MSVVINFKTDERVKEQAQSLADKFGLSLSDVLNMLLRNFIYKRELNLNLSEDDIDKIDRESDSRIQNRLA